MPENGSFTSDSYRRAVAAWVEVDDGVPVLCMDTERGETVAYELSPTAAGGLKDAIVNGPQVSERKRHDHSGREPEGWKDDLPDETREFIEDELEGKARSLDTDSNQEGSR